MTTVINTNPDRPPLPPVVCTSWCEQGDGHPAEVRQFDQDCHSAALATPLTWHGGEHGFATTFATHEPNGTEYLKVEFEHHGFTQGLYMEPAEALALVDALQQVLGQIGAGR
jgi:hypothetical protein